MPMHGLICVGSSSSAVAAAAAAAAALQKVEYNILIVTVVDSIIWSSLLQP